MGHFKKIFLEDEVAENPYAQKILKHFQNLPVLKIHRIDEIFQAVKKPYKQKRSELSIFIGKKRGQLVKEAPPAYGLSGEPHYYFIHAYNCLYECEYCYLQGYFHSPDLVFFVNHEEILEAMKEKLTPPLRTWFHAGEFSDSLAMSQITDEWGIYWDFFKTKPLGFLEMRTKSANIQRIEYREPLKNVIVSFSLMPAAAAKRFDLGAPPLSTRLKAIKRLATKGFQLGFHFDPIIDSQSIQDQYKQLIEDLLACVPQEQFHYVSLGTVRFTKDVYKEVKKNYAHSHIHREPFVVGKDGKKKYPYFQRMHLMEAIKKILLEKGVKEEKIYLCMEE